NGCTWRRNQLLMQCELGRARFRDRSELGPQQRSAQEIVGDDQPAVSADRQKPVTAGGPEIGHTRPSAAEQRLLEVGLDGLVAEPDLRERLVECIAGNRDPRRSVEPYRRGAIDEF